MEEHCLTVPGRFEYLAQIADFVRLTAQAAGWDEDETFRVQMAVDEACSNVIEHAYGANAQGEIQISCCVQEQGDLVISVRDTGRPFDPTSVPEPPIGAEVENLSEGGLGLYFMVPQKHRLTPFMRFIPKSRCVLKRYSLRFVIHPNELKLR